MKIQNDSGKIKDIKPENLAPYLAQGYRPMVEAVATVADPTPAPIEAPAPAPAARVEKPVRRKRGK